MSRGSARRRRRKNRRKTIRRIERLMHGDLTADVAYGRKMWKFDYTVFPSILKTPYTPGLWKTAVTRNAHES